jgi:hypothetical protein
MHLLNPAPRLLMVETVPDGKASTPVNHLVAPPPAPTPKT